MGTKGEWQNERRFTSGVSERLETVVAQNKQVIALLEGILEAARSGQATAGTEAAQ